MYMNWVQLQKAADGALAGANYLPFDTVTAQSAATTFAENNGVQASEITGTVVSADNLSIIRLRTGSAAFAAGPVRPLKASGCSSASTLRLRPA
jgi:hypothetical protein